MVAIEELQEARLGARGALAAQQAQPLPHVVQIRHIGEDVLHPEGGALSHGGGLCGLEVRKCQGGQIRVLFGEFRQVLHHGDQLSPQERQGLPHENQVRVVSHVAGGGAQVDDALRRRALLAVGVDMAHHIVANHALPRLGHLEVDVLDMGAQLVELLVGDVQTQLLFGLRQSHPQLPPGGELVLLGEDALHLPAGVTGGEGALEDFVVAHGRRGRRGENGKGRCV